MDPNDIQRSRLRDALRKLWKDTEQRDEDLYDLIRNIDNKQITSDGYIFFTSPGPRTVIGAIKDKDIIEVFDFGSPDLEEYTEKLKKYLNQPYDLVYKEQSAQHESESRQHESESGQPKHKSLFGRMKRMLGFKKKGGKRKTNRRKSRKSRKSHRRR